MKRLLELVLRSPPKVVMWWMALVLHLSSSHAQLTPPHEAVCSGHQILFVCQQLQGNFAIWTVNLEPGMMLSVHAPTIVGGVETFPNDPGYDFEITTTHNSTPFTSELSVTAAKVLHGVTVECRGFSGTYNSEILIASVDPPAVPSRVMKTVNNSSFTPSTASITLTWSASNGANNYTLIVNPPLLSGPSSLSTTTTSLQLTVLYNEEYSINITAHNCAGNNGTSVPLVIVGCSPPSQPANGRISEHISGAVGAMLTFQCNSGYMPQQAMVSTCLSNNSWDPIPKCKVIDCGTPSGGSGVIIEPYNTTKLNASITFHCEESGSSIVSSAMKTVAVCRTNGEWVPSPSSFECVNGTLQVLQCGPATAPVNGHINSNYSSTVEGSQITFHCDGDSPVMTSACFNGSWVPNPADLDCGSLPLVVLDPGVYAGVSVAILSLVIVLIAISILGIVGVKKNQGVRPKTFSFKLDSCHSDQNGSEYAQTRHLRPRINNQVGEEYSVLCHSTSENSKTHPVADQIDTLVYADIGPSSTKRSAQCRATSNIQDDHRVMYSTLNLALHQPVKKSSHNKSGPCPVDKLLDLDSLLIQLKPQVIDKWQQFAEAVGLSNIIQQLSKYSPDECIVEVFDQWLKSHPTKPTWRNVADVLNDIGLHQLAEDILKVYETGQLPITVDMDAIPENLTSDNGTPPPLPPKLEGGSLDCKTEVVQHGESSAAAAPPRPPKPPVRHPKPVSL